MVRKAIFLFLFAGALAHSINTNDFRGQALLPGEKELAKASGEPLFPVPTATRCIVIMVCQYMAIYLALAVCRTYQEITATGKGVVEDALRGAAQTLTYGPMLCVLFIACRMRVEFLSDGHDQPQIWVQRCMYGVTYAVMASTLLVLVTPLVTGKPLPMKPGSCDIEEISDDAHPNQTLLIVLTIARYLILLGLYVGLAGIIVGINIYLPPGASDLTKLPKPAPAVLCTMILAVLFFSTQLVIALCRTYEEFKGVAFPRLVSIMQEAATTVEFGPMLSFLFLVARMRALQHDAQPQAYAQNCMFAATGAMCMTTLLAIATPLALGGVMRVNPVTKEKSFEVPNPSLGYCLTVVRYICMLGFYGGAVGVIHSIYTFEAPGGHHATVPVSPTVHCVVNLTCQFFFVYGMMTVMMTVSEVTGVEMSKWRLFSALEASKSTLAFAPMLAILFVTTRMYALLITDKKGAPQAWVQDGMYMATWSLLISCLACLGTGLAMDDVVTDEDGNVTNKFKSFWIGLLMSIIRYVSMVLLYGGILIVIVGLFQMTPETANGRGSLPVVSEAVNATPAGDRPPSAGDVIGK